MFKQVNVIKSQEKLRNEIEKANKKIEKYQDRVKQLEAQKWQFAVGDRVFDKVSCKIYVITELIDNNKYWLYKGHQCDSAGIVFDTSDVYLPRTDDFISVPLTSDLYRYMLTKIQEYKGKLEDFGWKGDVR